MDEALKYLFIGVGGTAVLGLITKWVDRKVTARVQWRVGPPWYQTFADFIKLLGKETIVPESARMSGFLLSPLLGFVGVCVASAILWAVNIEPKLSFFGDLIVALYFLTIPSLAFIIGGSSSGNPHGAVGASREMKLVLSYELPFVLAILVAVYAKGKSFLFGTLVVSEAQGVLPTIAVAVAFLVALFCVQAKLGLVPFDIAEAECEIMGGVYVEYSGTPLAVIYLTRCMLHAILPIFLITVFWGGFSFHGLGWLWSILKYLLVVVVITLVRNTNPRVRIDHAMKFFWYGLTPVAVIMLALVVMV